MKASNAYHTLVRMYVPSSWKDVRSKVDETKSLIEMFNAWLNLFEAYPNMTIKSIMKYNVNRDFNCL